MRWPDLKSSRQDLGIAIEKMYATYNYDMQVQYAFGYCNLGEGEFELRTIYDFRRRSSEYMQETSENLIEKAFEQVTDEQTEVFQLRTGKLRTDNTQIASNIDWRDEPPAAAEEVLQRAHCMLIEEDQRRCKRRL